MSALVRPLSAVAALGFALGTGAEDPPPAGRAMTFEVTLCVFSVVEPMLPTKAEAGPMTLDRFRELAKGGRPAVVTRMRLSTLGQQTASVEQADDLPVASGQVWGGAQAKPQTSYERHAFG